MNHTLTRVVVVPTDGPHLTTEDAAGLTGWVHDCGAFVCSPDQPDRCGVCWSANRTGWAFKGQWQPAYVTREAS
jgi:hypothetical protein